MTKPAKIELSNYNENWPLMFEEEKLFLTKIVGNFLHGSIEHIGSTSVKGMVAKPVIDIMFGVKSLSLSKPAIEIITQNGYQYFPYKADIMDWFCKPSDEERTHHLYLVPYQSPLWLEIIKFRDILRSNPNISSEYALLKQSLAKQYQDNKEAYTDKKWLFIKSVISG